VSTATSLKFITVFPALGMIEAVVVLHGDVLVIRPAWSF
jgi:hypothetical protein